MQSLQTTGNQHGMAMQHAEPAEVLSVLKAAKAKGVREWAMIVVANEHGIRASEVRNPQVDDLDLKNGSVVGDRLKRSFRTTKVVTEHRWEPLFNEHGHLESGYGNVRLTAPTTCSLVGVPSFWC